MKNKKLVRLCLLFAFLLYVQIANCLLKSYAPAERIRVIIGFKEEIDESLIEAYRGQIVYTSRYRPFVEAYISQDDFDSLGKEPSVEYICISKPAQLYNETLPWGVERIRADLVWDKNRDLISDEGTPAGQGIKIAILDTGIDYNHSDLKDRVINGTSFVGGTYMDSDGHGTMVAGVVAASDNGAGLVGVAPRASLLAVKVGNNSLDIYPGAVVDGIDWSVEHGANIISMSLGIANHVPALRTACFEAHSKGALLIAASGNENQAFVKYPARYSEWVVAVGAVNQSDNRWVQDPLHGSNYGPELDFVAQARTFIQLFQITLTLLAAEPLWRCLMSLGWLP
jgi:subtilisin family serine protease